MLPAIKFGPYNHWNVWKADICDTILFIFSITLQKFQCSTAQQFFCNPVNYGKLLCCYKTNIFFILMMCNASHITSIHYTSFYDLFVSISNPWKANTAKFPSLLLVMVERSHECICLRQEMRGLYTHYLDVDLDLHLIPEQNMYVSSSTNWDSQDIPVSGSSWLALIRTIEYFTFRVKLEIVQYGLALQHIFDGQQAKWTRTTIIRWGRGRAILMEVN